MTNKTERVLTIGDVVRPIPGSDGSQTAGILLEGQVAPSSFQREDGAGARIGPRMTIPFVVTYLVDDSFADADAIAVEFHQVEWTLNQFLRDKSDGYFFVGEQVGHGEFAVGGSS